MTHPADFTTKDLAAGILGMHDRSYSDMLETATRAINAAIAAAVQAEREACAMIADKRVDTIKQDNMYPAFGLDGMQYEAERISAAIRARNESNHVQS